MPQHQRLLHLRAAEVEVAVLQPQVLAGQLRAASGWNGGVRLLLSTRTCSARTSISPVASLGLTVPSGRRATLPVTRSHILGRRKRAASMLPPRLPGRKPPGSCRIGREVDEQHAPMVAVRIDPAGQGHLLADVRGAQLTARMSS